MTTAMNTAKDEKGFRQSDMVMVAAMLTILGVLIVPVPTFMIDIFLVLSISISVLVMMFILELKQPLEFSSFPSVLLLVTLFRLALNVATTRQILLNAFGGHVIDAFGNFVVGGNYAVGVVVFLILITINFKVITAGSGRIAEVAARFTLDAMPGKQMSIDADLNQGIIDDKEATRRRETLRREADFYGAMDGASKFVRGDAVAGLIIAAVNIGAGFFIGIIQKGMTAGEAASRFTLLTIGDGLVQQVPALIISTAAGILVTRAASTENLATEVTRQLFMKPKQLMITGSILGVISIIPGLPFIPFMSLAATMGGVGYALRNRKLDATQAESAENANSKKALDSKHKQETLPSHAAGLRNVLTVSPMDVEIGFGLVSMVDRNHGGKLIERIGNLRSQIVEELGLILPPVNVRDNVNLKNNDYSLKIRGLEVARGSVKPGSLLAIDPSGEVKLDGYPAVKEPAFGFQSYWMPEGKRDIAESKGLTMVDCSTVITTHLSAISKRYAADILTRQDVSVLLDHLKETHPAVVQELIPNKMTIGGVHRVLQGLLREKVSIRDMAIIIETLADNAAKTQDVTLLVEQCRRALGAHIARNYLMPDGSLKALGLHPELETLIKKATHREASGIGTLALHPSITQDIIRKVGEAIQSVRTKVIEPVILCSPAIRPLLRQLTMQAFRDTGVLSFNEIPDSVQVEIQGLIPAPKVAGTELILDGAA
jgi:flagellar biosynthesis protein FlhA